MARLTIKEAVAIAPVSESTLRRDIRSGKVSSEKDDRGRRRIDSAELARVYGPLRLATHSNDRQMSAGDTPKNRTLNADDSLYISPDIPKIVALLENQIADLKAELQRATDRETARQTETAKLLDMLSSEQDKTRRLMLPKPEAHEQKTRGWLQRLIGA